MLRSLLVLTVCCFLADSVSALENPYAVKSIRIGIENTYKNGLWTPITLEWEPPIPDGYYRPFAIRCSDSDGTPITYHYSIHGEKTKNGTSVTVLAKLGRKDEPIQVSGLANTCYKTFAVLPPVNAERPIYLIFGNEDIGLQGAIAELMLREERRPLLVKVNSIADLPTEWFGYEAVEMVVLTTTEPQLFDGLTAESPQIQALNDWLKLGGKMLLCLGKDAEPLVAGCLSPFLPGKYDGMTELRISTPLERFVNSQRQIFMNGTEEAPFMKMPRIAEPQGITFLNDGDLPLVLRSAHGLGTIIYFGGDLSEKPLKNWRDRTTLVRNIMQWNRAQERGTQVPRSGAMLQLGYNDIAGQIRSALDQFEGVRVVPFSVILIILTAYWLVIGLFDWFFVHKVLKRPILTWITFPLWIVLFSVLTYVLAAPGRPGVEQWNTLDIWDVEQETEVYRHNIWMNRYSPRDWKLGGTFSNLGDGYYSWNGLPGSGLGGMAPKTVSPSIWQVGSDQIDYGHITNVPIQTRSTKSFFGQFSRDCPNSLGRITAQLSDEEGVPIGTIEVHDKTPHSLKNCILVYGRWVLELGDIEPGQTITVTKTTPRRELRDLLIPPKARENEGLRGLATYNPQSTDLEYIVRVMSLHRALGGYESTGLHCAYQPSLDMSELLTADRALLLGVVGRKYGSGEQEDVVIGGIQFFRQSFPITLTSSSPRWRGERHELKGDALEEKVQPGFLDKPQ